MMSFSPLIWLLDVEAYEFNVGVLKEADITGRTLIVSHQLWSLLRESKVYSALIGPGYFKGVAEEGNRRVEIKEHLSMIMFDPTVLRYEEPLPLVDIINPEVIDPLGTTKSEEIMTVISNLMIEKGNILAADEVATVMGEGGLPTVAHYTDILKKIRVNHVSGVQRARFLLGGTNRPLYSPFVEWFNSRKYNNFQRQKVMSFPNNSFVKADNAEALSDWMIVEKAGAGGVGVEGLQNEYESVLSNIQKESDSYVFEL